MAKHTLIHTQRHQIESAAIPVVAAKLRMPSSSSHSLIRLETLMNRLWDRRLGVMVAPAGSGKTTLLTRFAASSGVPVAWYRCESWDTTPHHLLSHLEGAFSIALGRPMQRWSTVEDAIAALEQIAPPRMLLAIDDAHSIAGTPAEAALACFVEYAPPGLLTIIASRSQPGFNLSRLRVAGALGEITGDDLRFRSWEVESLFRDFYREPLPPVELAELARRTEGWAAGLQLFHLATSGKALDERRRILRALGGGSRLVREYLASNVLDELPSLLRNFLIDTCVLGRLSGPICDEFLNRTDSTDHLQELERRQIFTSALGSDGHYRYHEVLRSHLEYVLVGQVGDRGLRARYKKAGAVLEHFDAIPEALHAYCRSEEWTAVDRLLGQNGAQLAGRTGVWIDSLPPAVLDHDPWLLLASARRNRAEGRWRNAIELYQRAERAFTGLEAAQLCQRERAAVLAWLTRTPPPPTDSTAWLRQAAVRDPLAVRSLLTHKAGAQEMMIAGIASLLAGELREAKQLFARALNAAEEDETISIAARLGAAVVAQLAGEVTVSGGLELAIEDADSNGFGFVARLGRACAALTTSASAISDAQAVGEACLHLGDEWGAALAALLQGWGQVLACADKDAVLPITVAWDRFRDLGAGVLEAWSNALLALALARQGDASATSVALRAESLANSVVVEGPKVYAYLALAIADRQHAAQFLELAKAWCERMGWDKQIVEAAAGPGPKELSIKCFGEFHFDIAGRPVDMKRMKPRTQALLRRLCADAGSPVHREILEDVLWPGADAESAARNLHVAVSSLRQALEPGVMRGASSLIVREGDSYRLVLPPGSAVDIRTFEDALSRSRRARQTGNLEHAVIAFHEAAELAAQELFPEEGSADWVIERRARVSAALLESARPLARLLLARSQSQVAVEVCIAALTTDRYDDESWRLLIQAREKAGDKAGARLAQAEYEKVVSELDPRPTGS